MARIHAPLSSFGAELQAVLREGANKKLQITFPTRALATRFKQRLNALRHAMKDANHPDWEQLYRCGIYQHEGDACTVSIGPKDSEFRDILAKAGITGLDAPMEVHSVTVGASEPGSVDSFLSDLRDATSVQRALDEISPSDEEPDVNNL